jgi:uncharacterized protein YuzE
LGTVRWEYDATSDSLYVYVRDEEIDRQEEMPDGTIADVAASGDLVGIEVLAAHRSVAWTDIIARYNLSTEQVASLTFINEALSCYTTTAGAENGRTTIESQAESYAPAALQGVAA